MPEQSVGRVGVRRRRGAQLGDECRGQIPIAVPAAVVQQHLADFGGVARAHPDALIAEQPVVRPDFHPVGAGHPERGEQLVPREVGQAETGRAFKRGEEQPIRGAVVDEVLVRVVRGAAGQHRLQLTPSGRGVFPVQRRPLGQPRLHRHHVAEGERRPSLPGELRHEVDDRLVERLDVAPFEHPPDQQRQRPLGGRVGLLHVLGAPVVPVAFEDEASVAEDQQRVGMRRPGQPGRGLEPGGVESRGGGVPRGPGRVRSRPGRGPDLAALGPGVEPDGQHQDGKRED